MDARKIRDLHYNQIITHRMTGEPWRVVVVGNYGDYSDGQYAYIRRPNSYQDHLLNWENCDDYTY